MWLLQIFSVFDTFLPFFYFPSPFSCFVHVYYYRAVNACFSMPCFHFFLTFVNIFFIPSFLVSFRLFMFSIDFCFFCTTYWYCIFLHFVAIHFHLSSVAQIYYFFPHSFLLFSLLSVSLPFLSFTLFFLFCHSLFPFIFPSCFLYNSIKIILSFHFLFIFVMICFSIYISSLSLSHSFRSSSTV